MTHGLSYLKSVDQIYVLANGQITERGTYQQLLQQKGAFAEILMTYLKEKVEHEEEEDDIGREAATSPPECKLFYANF